MQPLSAHSDSPLHHFVGSWRGDVTVEAPSAAPRHYTQENTFLWTLGGLFLEERGTGTDGSAFVGYWSLADGTGKYRAHYFLAPSGDAVLLTHEWHPATRSFTGFADLGGGYVMRAEDHFIDANTYQWSVTVQDGAGQTVNRMHAREHLIRRGG
jgi:hypothetical protein